MEKLTPEEVKMWRDVIMYESIKVGFFNYEACKALYEKVRWSKNSQRANAIYYLKKAIEEYEQSVSLPAPVPAREVVVCTKFAFDTKDLARRELKRIRQIAQKRGQPEYSIPHRSYECEHCGKWHHTRMPIEEYEKLTHGNNNRDQGIQTEVEGQGR